jgi:hypothetical protein
MVGPTLVVEGPLVVGEGPLVVGEGLLLVGLAVLLYTLRRLGPPQNSELFPLQTIEQLLAAAGAPPLTIAFPQSITSKVKVNGQISNLEQMDSTYNTRQSIPSQPGYNPQRSRQLYSFQHCFWKHHRQEVSQKSEPSH